jgi:hypothetical protein
MWDGAPQPSPASSAQVVRMPVPSPPASAADAVRDVLAGVSRPNLKEPVATSAEQLARWTRTPGAPSPDAPLSDERRSAVALGGGAALLGLEWWLRRSASVETPHRMRTWRLVLPDPAFAQGFSVAGSVAAVIGRVRWRWRVRSIALAVAVAGAAFASASCPHVDVDRADRIRDRLARHARSRHLASRTPARRRSSRGRPAHSTTC